MDISNGANDEVRSGEDSLYGWPFMVFFDWRKVNEYWNAHALEPQGDGFCAKDIEFEIDTTMESARYFRCSLGPLKLQVTGGDGSPLRWVVRRRILSCVVIHLARSLGGRTRIITQVRHVIEEQGIELCLEIDLEANAGRYDSEHRVSLGWAKYPVFYLSSAYQASTRDEQGALPYALFFKGQADSSKFIQLGKIQPLSTGVLKPMHFWLRSVTPVTTQSSFLALHPVIGEHGSGSFPNTYPSIPVSTAGVSMVLDATRYPGAVLAQQDIQDCPSLFIPPGLVQSGVLETDGSIVRSRFERQLNERPFAQVQVEGQSFGLEPMVRVINGAQTVTLSLLPSNTGEPPKWGSQYGGQVEPKGWGCTFLPDEREASGIETLCEYCVIQAAVDNRAFTSTVVVLRGVPTGYIRLTPSLHGHVKLCYRMGGQEVVIPHEKTYWNGLNCFIASNGAIERFDNEPFCIIRAHSDLGEALIWAVLILPVPLIDAQTALSLDIG